MPTCAKAGFLHCTAVAASDCKKWTRGRQVKVQQVFDVKSIVCPAEIISDVQVWSSYVVVIVMNCETLLIFSI